RDLALRGEPLLAVDAERRTLAVALHREQLATDVERGPQGVVVLVGEEDLPVAGGGDVELVLDAVLHEQGNARSFRGRPQPRDPAETPGGGVGRARRGSAARGRRSPGCSLRTGRWARRPAIRRCRPPRAASDRAPAG